MDSFKNLPGFVTPKTLDHKAIVTRCVIICKGFPNDFRFILKREFDLCPSGTRLIGMNKSLPSKVCSVVVALVLLAEFTGSALADDHNYQVTGPVTAVSDTSITVTKSGKPWTVSRDAGTKVTGDLKVGSKVTIQYHMTADTVTVK